MTGSFSSFQSACRKALVATGMLVASKSGGVPPANAASGLPPLPRSNQALLVRGSFRRSLNSSAGPSLPLIHLPAAVRQNPSADIRQQFHADPPCFPKEAREARHELPKKRQNASTSGVCRHG